MPPPRIARPQTQPFHTLCFPFHDRLAILCNHEPKWIFPLSCFCRVSHHSSERSNQTRAHYFNRCRRSDCYEIECVLPFPSPCKRRSLKFATPTHSNCARDYTSQWPHTNTPQQECQKLHIPMVCTMHTLSQLQLQIQTKSLASRVKVKNGPLNGAACSSFPLSPL